METLRIDFGDIVAGILFTTIGLISVIISRLKSKDYSLLSVYTIIAAAYVLINPAQIPDPAINPFVVIRRTNG